MGIRGMDAALLQASILEADVVIIVQVVDADDAVAPTAKHVHQFGADESGGSGYKYLHDCVTFSRNCGGMNDTATATKPSMATSSLRSFLMRLM